MDVEKALAFRGAEERVKTRDVALRKAPVVALVVAVEKALDANKTRNRKVVMFMKPFYRQKTFWTAVAAFLSTLLPTVGVDEETTRNITTALLALTAIFLRQGVENSKNGGGNANINYIHSASHVDHEPHDTD